ncbi:MAG: hypothetical protein RIQ56_696, partial [Candidatus Parcubacteria bacterium]
MKLGDGFRPVFNTDERSNATGGSGEKIDSGPKYALRSLSLMTGVSEEVLDRLTSQHGFPKGHVAQIKELAKYVAPEDSGGDAEALKGLDLGGAKYKDISALASSDFVLQRLLSYITQQSLPKNKYGPTYLDMYDWIQRKKSSDEGFTLAELKEAIVSRMRNAKLSADQLSKLDQRIGDGTTDDPSRIPTLRQKLTSEYVLQKIGAPDDVDRNQRAVFESLVTKESYGFMKESIAALVPQMQEAIMKMPNVPEVQRKYLAQYVLPRIIPDDLKSSIDEERRMITKARNMLWSLATHGIVDVRLDERNGTGPKLNISLAPEFTARLAAQTAVYLEGLTENPRGNRAVPVYMSDFYKSQNSRGTDIQNLWSSLRNRIPVRHKIPEKEDVLEKLLKSGEETAEALPSAVETLTDLSPEQLLSPDFQEQLRGQIASLEAKLAQLREASSGEKSKGKEELAVVQTALSNRQFLLERLAVYAERITSGEKLRDQQPSVDSLLSKAGPKGELRPIDRRALEARGTLLRKFLRAFGIQVDELKKKADRANKRNPEEKHLAKLLVGLYEDKTLGLAERTSAKDLEGNLTDQLGAIDSALSAEKVR